MRNTIFLLIILLVQYSVKAQNLRDYNLISSRDFSSFQSSTSYGQEANLAFDGNRTTSSRTGLEETPFLKIDLRARYRINAINLYAPNLNDFYILFSKAPIVSRDLTTLLADPWIDYVHVSGNIPAGGLIPVNHILANYVTIISASTGSLSVNEVNLYGDGPIGPSQSEICNNGIDDDNDGRTDCDDPDCGPGQPIVEQVSPSCPSCSDGSITVFSTYADYVSIYGGGYWVPASSDPWTPTVFDGLPHGNYPIKVTRGDDCSTTRDDDPPLSDLAEDVLDAIEATDGPHINPLATGDNSLVDVLVDGPEIFATAASLIRNAEFEIDIAIATWERQANATNVIRNAFLANEAQRQQGDSLLVRVLLSQKSPFGNPAANITNEINSWGLDKSKWKIGVANNDIISDSDNLHHKIFIIDGKKMVVTGANIQSKNDPGSPWRDTGYWIEGDAGLSALADFDGYWNDRDSFLLPIFIGVGLPILTPIPLGGFNDFMNPDRSWLPQVTTISGSSSIIYAGTRPSHSVQNEAWLTLMDGAQHTINIATPNISGDLFKNAIVDAVKRGVTVNLLTGRCFNGNVFYNWFGNGYNRETVSWIKQKIRSEAPETLSNFNLKWYSFDGIQEIIGNPARSMHTKFLSVDNSIAMVGSGNQDSFSWGLGVLGIDSDEINFVIDNPADVAMMHDDFFTEDFSKGIDQVIEFYEGINITQDIVAIENTFYNHNRDFTQDDSSLLGVVDLEYYSVNDEAHSAVINKTPKGKRIRIFNSTNINDQYKKSWMEIVTKNDVESFNINSLQSSFETNDLRVIYNPNPDDDHLNGKVSYVTVDDYNPQPRVLLYEGLNATESIVCDILVENSLSLDFTSYSYCANDEAKSIKLLDMQEGAVYRLHDDSQGSTNDDFVIIEIKRDFHSKVIPTFEADFEDADVKVSYFFSGDLNGKVSFFKAENNAAFQPKVELYSESNANGNLVCIIPMLYQNGHLNFKNSSSNIYNCSNDAAQSVKLLHMKKGKSFTLFDNQYGSHNDDFITITIKKDFDSKIIGNLEDDFQDQYVKVEYSYDGNLNGKVSSFNDSNNSKINLYKDGALSVNNIICTIALDFPTEHMDFTGSTNIYGCSNDQAKSAELINMKKGKIYKLFDNAGGSTGDDYLIIEIKKDFSYRAITNFENSFENDSIKVTYCCGGNLNGKVSSFRDY